MAMNFSLKKGPKAPPRLQLDNDLEQKTQPKSVSTVEEAASTERVIKLGSNQPWRAQAVERQDRRQAEIDRLAETHPNLSQSVIDEMAYEKDVASRPEAPTADTYQELSVDDFGAALLRGLGKEPETEPKHTVVAPELTRRSALLGVGAQASPVAKTKVLASIQVPLKRKRARASKRAKTID